MNARIGLAIRRVKRLAPSEWTDTIPRSRIRVSVAKILVIDDERPIRDALAKVFRREGHTVRLAENGAVGVDLYREDPADVVVTDMTMPVKGGIETLAELKRDYPSVKVIAMSGGWPDSAFDPLTIARDLGALHTLPKPFEIQEMLAAVRAALGGRAK